MIDTDGYLLLGLAVIAMVLLNYSILLLARFSNVRKTIRVLEQLRDE